jgi:hypothetical protein
MKLSHHAFASPAALVLLIGAGSAASASTTIGEAPPTTGVPLNCGPGMALQASVGSGVDYAVPPTGGVITSWSSSLTGSVAFATFRGSGTSWTRVHTWDGSKWNFSSDWYQADEQILKPMVKAAADKYAVDKKLTRRTPEDCQS